MRVGTAQHVPMSRSLVQSRWCRRWTRCIWTGFFVLFASLAI